MHNINPRMKNTLLNAKYQHYPYFPQLLMSFWSGITMNTIVDVRVIPTMYIMALIRILVRILCAIALMVKSLPSFNYL